MAELSRDDPRLKSDTAAIEKSLADSFKMPAPKFVSNEVVQDTSKMDTSEDAKANARLAARQSAASTKPTAKPRVVKSEPANAGKPPDAVAAEGKPTSPTPSSAPPKVNKPKVAPATGTDFASRFKQAEATHALNTPKSSTATPKGATATAVARRSNTGAPLTARQAAGQDKAKANTKRDWATGRENVEKAATMTERQKVEERLKKARGYAKGGKTNPFAKKGESMKSEASDKAFKDKPNPFGKKQAPPFGKKDNPFKKKGNPFASGKPFAKGGKIDGCAVRGHTKAKRST